MVSVIGLQKYDSMGRRVKRSSERKGNAVLVTDVIQMYAATPRSTLDLAFVWLINRPITFSANSRILVRPAVTWNQRRAWADYTFVYSNFVSLPPQVVQG